MPMHMWEREMKASSLGRQATNARAWLRSPLELRPRDFCALDLSSAPMSCFT